jgi:hypothetical protein
MDWDVDTIIMFNDTERLLKICLKIERLVKQNTLEDEIYFNETSEEFQKFQTYFKQSF